MKINDDVNLEKEADLLGQKASLPIPTKAILKQDFETKTIKVEETVDGKKVMVLKVVPRYLAGKEFSMETMNSPWLSKEEKGGRCVVLGPLDYVRIKNPDGTPTSLYELFDYK